ncbi:cupin domain-containing protein [Bosea sp. BK604]|uniref:cupin domain-containing protein n=1 Tax=Bosea sp. BK604 TaxID=2512180 RepID=UPI0010454035|nr:cupin domain-containing protein [Bosea sp. BK604]TCR61452.1 putative cupin superfamily protein [Bosea sp. BK604]
MPKLDIDAIPLRTGSYYPAEFVPPVQGRSSRSLGDAGGLTQFGVRICYLDPGAWSSQRHWHEQEDEFVMALTGDLVLIDNAGEQPLRPGECAAFKAGDGNGHKIVNRSSAPGSFLVVGTRAPVDRAHYPDIDLVMNKDADGVRYTHRDGTPY